MDGRAWGWVLLLMWIGVALLLAICLVMLHRLLN